MKHQTLYSIALASSLSVLAACSSSGGGGPSVPDNAITFDETNTATAVAMGVDMTVSVMGAETEQLSANDGLGALSQAFNTIRNNPQAFTGQNTVTGVAYSFTESCATGQINYSGDVSGVEPYDSGSFSGTMTFVDCQNEPGIVTNGSLSAKSSWTADGGYSDTASGDLNSTYTGVGSISVTGINHAETGNENSGAYSINTLYYTLNPSIGGGFAVQVTTALVGNENETCPTSGVVLMTGANSTQARATFNSNYTVTIEVNTGSGFVEVSGSPFGC
jgi:hypothetical protein